MANHDTLLREDDLQSTCSIDDFFDEIFNDTTHACTHTHTCNPAGPDLSHHTHTCFHVHTKILSPAPTPTPTLSATAASADAADQTAESADTGTEVAAANNGPSSKKRPCGNREAVRKYRQKKKAHAASLADENQQLREENQRLRAMVQDMSTLEAENVNLKFLLVDLRSRIDGALGSFPYQRTMKAGVESACGGVAPPPMNPAGGTQVMTSCGVSCDYQNYCAVPRSNGKVDAGTGGFPSMESQGFGVCELGTVSCFGNTNRNFV